MGGVIGAEEGAQSRDDRIESYYQESARDLAEWLVDAEGMSQECDEGDRSERYRAAWLSARQRAATEAVHATEALTIRDAEIVRLKAALSASRLAEVDPYI